MKRLYLSNLLLFCVIFSFAQNLDYQQQYFSNWINKTANNIHQFKGRQLPATEQNVVQVTKQFLEANYPELQPVNSELQSQYFKQSPLGFHITFTQLYNQLPIYGTEVKVNLSKDFKVVSIFQKMAFTNSWPTLNEEKLAQLPGKTTVIFNGIKPELGKVADVYYPEERKWYEEIKTESGFSHSRDLGRYLTEPYMGPDSLVYVYVFYPDPNQSEQTVFKNGDGKDDIQLTNARKLKTTELRYLSDSFWAENRFVKMVEPTNQNFVPANSRIDTFDFTRADPRFDQINALYHITSFHYLLDSLGFDSLMKYQIEVNSRTAPVDNSSFTRETGEPKLGRGILEYGYSIEGSPHVDDAEDADVVIHEFGHAISYNANLNSLAAYERNSLDEGLCDYLACSYSRSITDYEWQKLYNWDGHNEFWEGRSCDANKTMADFDKGENIYYNGEIFSSALMNVWTELGSDTTDALVLGSLYMLSSSSKFIDIAKVILDVDSLYHGGKNKSLLCSTFVNRKFLPADYCFTGIGEVEIIEKLEVDDWLFRNNGELKVRLPKNETAQISVYDPSGRLVVSFADYESATVLPISNTVAGVYFIEIRTETSWHKLHLVRY
ncbi:MAG: T9SS type A sorting domain-containing protein [Bacteroidetes bacterium]|nr:T9SS type A sorting domain-containing protein [Bacteroidota bacterium]